MKKLIIAAASTGVLLLGACTNDESDFKENAEAFIESSEIEDQLGTTFSGTTCTKPATVEAGETFTCTSTDADGKNWDFEAVIRSENSYEVTDAESFAREVQNFVEGPSVATEAGTTFTNADCANPSAREAGVTLTCTAVDASGTTWDFTVTVTGRDSFEVTEGEPRA